MHRAVIDFRSDARRVFEHPLEIIVAHSLAEVRGVIDRAEAAAHTGLYAVGYLAYEAAPAFDSHLRTHPPKQDLPLACFALFDGWRPDADHESDATTSPIDWQLDITPEAYVDAIVDLR